MDDIRRSQWEYILIDHVHICLPRFMYLYAALRLAVFLSTPYSIAVFTSLLTCRRQRDEQTRNFFPFHTGMPILNRTGSDPSIQTGHFLRGINPSLLFGYVEDEYTALS